MSTPLHILLVDDDMLLHKLMQYQLGSSGITLTTAGSISEGLRKAELDKPDFILLDFKMNDQRNPDDLKRNVEEFSKIAPVVIFTGFSQEVEDSDSGAIGVIPKDNNFKASSLIRSLHSLFYPSDSPRLLEIDKKIQTLKDMLHAPQK